MLQYLEKNFGERALNGDLEEVEKLRAKIKDLEDKLEV